jgi:hypothetical protein
MSVQRKFIVSLMLLGFLVYMISCGAAKRNAQVTPQLKASEWKPKVQELANSMGDYNVYAAGITKSRPWAIGFVPKNSTRRLTGSPDQWYKIEDKKTLDEIIGWMESKPGAIPRLMSVLGPEPERAFFGYIYSPMPQISTRVMDDNTIYVYVPDPAMGL